MKRLLSLMVVATISTAIAGVSFAGQAPATKKKLVAPVRGEANVEITSPDTRIVKDEVVTKIRVKNISKAPIDGFRVEENWSKGNDSFAGDIYRHPRPLQAGEVIEITLKTPRARTVGARNQYQFSHANGGVKPTQVKKLG